MRRLKDGKSGKTENGGEQGKMCKVVKAIIKKTETWET